MFNTNQVEIRYINCKIKTAASMFNPTAVLWTDVNYLFHQLMYRLLNKRYALESITFLFIDKVVIPLLTSEWVLIA